jgi:hypothetical protein
MEERGKTLDTHAARVSKRQDKASPVRRRPEPTDTRAVSAASCEPRGRALPRVSQAELEHWFG